MTAWMLRHEMTCTDFYSWLCLGMNLEHFGGLASGLLSSLMMYSCYFMALFFPNPAAKAESEQTVTVWQRVRKGWFLHGDHRVHHIVTGKLLASGRFGKCNQQDSNICMS